MREIKFRGKRIDNGEWVYGHGITQKPYTQIISEIKNVADFHTEVSPESVGQFIGLTDKNCKEIYEGDIYITERGKSYKVMFLHGCFVGGTSENNCGPLGWDKDSPDNFSEDIEVIGNIYENPNLLQ